jgi:type VI secretion system protein ImpB
VARESVFEKKKRVRPPRVHITYDVEIGGAQVLKEIPFVVGVLADLSGQPKEKLPRLKDRRFTEVDRDNFDDVLKSMKPRVAMKVDNKLKDDGSKLSVELEFQKMEDFSPERVAGQVKPLADLLEVRSKLKDLLSRTEGNDRLEELLEAIIEKNDVRDKLSGALDVKAPGAGSDGSGDAGPEGSE